MDWEGRADFKKFKKVRLLFILFSFWNLRTATQRSFADRAPPIELVLDDEVEQSEYRGTMFAVLMLTHMQDTSQVKSEHNGDFTPRYSSKAGSVRSDMTDDEIALPRNARQRRTQAQRAAAAPKARSTRANSRQPTAPQPSSSKQPLFLEEEDEMMDDPDADMDESQADANAVASQLGREDDLESVDATMRTSSRTQELRARGRRRQLVYED